MFFNALVGVEWGEIGLPTGWMGRTGPDQMDPDGTGGGMERSDIAGSRIRISAICVLRCNRGGREAADATTFIGVAGEGCGVFVSVRQDNHKTLRTKIRTAI